MIQRLSTAQGLNRKYDIVNINILKQPQTKYGDKPYTIQIATLHEDMKWTKRVVEKERRVVVSIDVQSDPNDECLQGIPGPLMMPRGDPLQRAGPGKQRHGHCLLGRSPANASEL